ncbi:MAG: hypothetical protein WBH00_06650 [Xanthobacteraceae bacterium]
MRSVPSAEGQENQLREVVAHLGSALGQSDYTDDQIIIGHLRSAHDLALNVLRSGASSRSSPSIVPAGTEETVYLVEDCLGSLGCVWREAEVGKTDLETVIIDLLAGEYRDPRRVIAFNTVEHWSEDVSEDVAREIQRRSDLTYNDVPSALQAFVDRHAGREKQLALRLV